MISKSMNHSTFCALRFAPVPIHKHLLVADSSIDVVISNSIINLSPDKGQVFDEIPRVFKPGGRVAISDMVSTALLSEAVRTDLALHIEWREPAPSDSPDQPGVRSVTVQAIKPAVGSE